MPRIPVDPLLPIIQSVIDSERETIESLAERACIERDTLEKQLAGKRESIGFDEADRILCALGLVYLWRHNTALREIYTRVDLSEPDEYLVENERRCAAPGCGNVFTLPEPTTPDALTKRGYARKIYCSTSCAERTRRISSGKLAPLGQTRNERCRNGHKRTPKNTEYLSNGTRRCRICQRERTQECRERKRQQLVLAVAA